MEKYQTKKLPHQGKISSPSPTLALVQPLASSLARNASNLQPRKEDNKSLDKNSPIFIAFLIPRVDISSKDEIRTNTENEVNKK